MFEIELTGARGFAFSPSSPFVMTFASSSLLLLFVVSAFVVVVVSAARGDVATLDVSVEAACGDVANGDDVETTAIDAFVVLELVVVEVSTGGGGGGFATT